jgi:hypothetical protein
MSLRPIDLLDRTATLVAGLALTAAGVAATVWPTHLVRTIPDTVHLDPVLLVTQSTWWPLELAGAGTLLVLISLLWLVPHLPIHGSPMLRVPGAIERGIITVNLDGIATAAATALAQNPDVFAAKGKAVTDRGTPTIDLTVTVAHPAALPGVLTAIDGTCAHIAQVTGDSRVAARAMVQIAKTGGTPRNLK